MLWIVLALVLLYFFMICPNLKRKDLSALKGRRYAHRGLHDGNRKITMSLNDAIKKTTGVVTNHTTEFDSEATQLQKLMTLDNLSSEILYADILDGVDLQYVVEPLNVKENIIEKKRKNTLSTRRKHIDIHIIDY